MSSKYKRVLLKLSGEQFSGDKDHGIDVKFVAWIAREIKKAKDLGVDVAVVVGGGNFIRGKDFEGGDEVDKATAHYMGMLTTVLNGQVLMDTLQHNDQPARVMSSLQVAQVCEPFIRRKAIRHMEKGRVVVLSGGTGKPFVTTDSGSVLFALELGCDIVLKATKVDGIYDKDPAEHNDAVKYDELTYQDAMANHKIRVMDKAALGLAMEEGMPVKVFKLEENSIAKVVSGESLGTQIG